MKGSRDGCCREAACILIWRLGGGNNSPTEDRPDRDRATPALPPAGKSADRGLVPACLSRLAMRRLGIYLFGSGGVRHHALWNTTNVRSAAEKMKERIRAAQAAMNRRQWREAASLWEVVVHQDGNRNRAGELAHAYEQLDMLEAALTAYDIELAACASKPKQSAAIVRRQLILQAALERDTLNKQRYGSGYPRYGERIWVHASAVSYMMPQPVANAVSGKQGNVKDSTAFVARKWPEEDLLPVKDHEKLDGCMKRWSEGRTWEETGLIERMLRQIEIHGQRNKCNTRQDVLDRYERIDSQFRVIKAEGRIRTRAELDQRNFRELGGVFMHLGPGGEPVFGSRGYHRFAMARVLDLWIPCQIGIVHESALPLLESYRQEPH